MRAAVFTFTGHRFDEKRGRATFYYRGPSGRHYAEKVDFHLPETGFVAERRPLLRRVLDLALFVLGTSYYKADPVPEIKTKRPISPALADLLNAVYQEGLSQFAFENHLERKDLAHFHAQGTATYWQPRPYDGAGILSLQSGGKDSLLTAALLTKDKKPFRPLYISSSASHPAVLDELGKPLLTITRHLDKRGLRHAKMNGHVPITYINYALALVQAVLLGWNEVIAGIADEGVAPHAMVGDLEVRHQWAKTQAAEDLLNNFITTSITPSLRVSSLLRGRRELDIAADFAAHCWPTFGHSFSSCNVANYGQNHDNKTLHWCGHCAKCANSFLLFAPFLPAEELISTIGAGRDLFKDPELIEIFRGLLGIDGVLRPFECIGEVPELREAYHRRAPGLGPLPFEVPEV